MEINTALILCAGYGKRLNPITLIKPKPLIEINQITNYHNIKIDYKSILIGAFHKIDLEPKYNVLIKVSKIKKSKYDLIADYKKVISHNRKEEVRKRLEILSESKYKDGDYKKVTEAQNSKLL